MNHTQVQQLAYEKYLKEVMSVLMTDKDFAGKIVENGTILSKAKVATFSAVFA